MTTAKAPPDFSTWKVEGRFPIYYNSEDDKVSYDGGVWWGAVARYVLPSDENIIGVEFDILGKGVVIKSWGFRNEDHGVWAVRREDDWYILNKTRGEEFVLGYTIDGNLMTELEIVVQDAAERALFRFTVKR